MPLPKNLLPNHIAVVECLYHDDFRLDLVAPWHALQSVQIVKNVHPKQHQIQQNQVVRVLFTFSRKDYALTKLSN